MIDQFDGIIAHDTAVKIVNFSAFRGNGNLLTDDEWLGYKEKIRIRGDVVFANDTNKAVGDSEFDLEFRQSSIPLGSDSTNLDGHFDATLDHAGLFEFVAVNFSANLVNVSSPYFFDATPLDDHQISLRVDPGRPWAEMVKPHGADLYLKPSANGTREILVNITDFLGHGANFTLHYWRQGVDDSNSSKDADPLEYQLFDLTTESGMGPGTKIYEAWIPDGGNANWDWNSIYLSGNDSASNPIIGGAAGLNNDLFSWQTRIEQAGSPVSVTISAANFTAVTVGDSINLTVVVNDTNGASDVFSVDVNLSTSSKSD